jgi:hypothetical protein
VGKRVPKRSRKENIVNQLVGLDLRLGASNVVGIRVYRDVGDDVQFVISPNLSQDQLELEECRFPVLSIREWCNLNLVKLDIMILHWRRRHR